MWINFCRGTLCIIGGGLQKIIAFTCYCVFQDKQSLKTQWQKDNVILKAADCNVRHYWHSEIQQIDQSQVNTHILSPWCLRVQLLQVAFFFMKQIRCFVLNSVIHQSLRGHISLWHLFGVSNAAPKSGYTMCWLLETVSSDTQISCNTFRLQSGKSLPVIRSSVVAVFVVNTVPLWGLNVCVSKE